MNKKVFTPLETKSNKFNVRLPKGDLSLTGFTILELLVVVVILGLLISILLPVFGRVREGARRAQCTNNLRQHGIAWYLYLDDHGECFPKYSTPADQGGATQLTFGGWQGSAYDSDFGAKWRVLNPYLDIDSDTSPGIEVFRCPDDIKPLEGRPENAFAYYGNSYFFNERILYFNSLSSPRPRPLSTIISPRDKAFLEMCYFYNNPGHGGKAYVAFPNVQVMVLFMDGHVAGTFLWDADFADHYTNPSQKVVKDPNGDDLWYN